MTYPKKSLILLTQVIIWALLTAIACGQATPPKPMSETEFVALLQSRLKQVDDVHDLDEAGKAKAKELYQQALGEMEAAKRWAAKAADFENKANQAPVDLGRTKAELALLPAQPTVGRNSVMMNPSGVSLMALRKVHQRK